MLVSKEKRICKYCSETYEANQNHQKFCSRLCAANYWGKKKRPRAHSPSKQGTMSELTVSLDLMRHGWEVFSGLSPDASCDLIAMRDGALMRVQVKTVSKSKDGALTSADLRNDLGRYDVLALIDQDGTQCEYYTAERVTWQPLRIG